MPGVLGEYLLGRHAEVGEDRPASLRRALSSVSFPVGPGALVLALTEQGFFLLQISGPTVHSTTCARKAEEQVEPAVTSAW